MFTAIQFMCLVGPKELSRLSLYQGVSFIMSRKELNTYNGCEGDCKVVAKRRRSEEGWIEKECTGCGEWWPDDGEFFFKSGNGLRRLMDKCKACYIDRRRVAGTKPVATYNIG